ncbi:MAG: hypothetical protein FJ096_00250 [Deltaproteobacteria bacterium]|nr:hypothetical protein [Deltaproteobacteria bacterium]
MTTTLFVPHARLEGLVDARAVELAGSRLTLTHAGGSYLVEEAVRVLREVATGEDPRQLVGTVQRRSTLTEECAGELLGESLLVEDSAYEIVSGVLLVAEQPFVPGPSGVGERAFWAALAVAGRRV